MFKKTKTFAQITAAFSKPIAELEAYVNKKRSEANALLIAATDHDNAAIALRDDAATLHAEADEAGAFQYRLEQFLKPAE
ncbi:hypothetical protein ZHAWSFBX_CDS_0023 [Agrobacterium phage Alfirin]|nr:hypothetical protein ZHAWSFBX_CDS_0023 [Agrobacterium phage Alfirin]